MSKKDETSKELNDVEGGALVTPDGSLGDPLEEAEAGTTERLIGDSDALDHVDGGFGKHTMDGT